MTNNDLFQERKELLNTLDEFNKDLSNRVVALCGDWGSGKSFFIDKFIEGGNKIEERNYTIIKFDAWEHQAHENINSIFLDAIYDELMEKPSDGQSRCQFSIGRWGKQANKLAAEIISSLPHIGKIIVEEEEIFQSELFKIIANATLTNMIDDREFYDIFIELLFSSKDKNVNEKDLKDKKYLLIIDELDRCDPNYAMDLIKKVVYLNKKIIEKGYSLNFLVSINKVEFGNLLKKYYGESYDSHQYFDKIFDYEFELPGGMDNYDYFHARMKNIAYDGNAIRTHMSAQLSPITTEIFEKLNYRKVAILAEELREHDKNIFHKKLCLIRFALEILKLNDYKTYLKIKETIFFMKNQWKINVYRESGGLHSFRVPGSSDGKEFERFNTSVSEVSSFFRLENFSVYEFENKKLVDGFYKTENEFNINELIVELMRDYKF